MRKRQVAMPRKQSTTTEEIGGSQFPDLSSAQAAARSALAIDLAATIHELLAAGVLVQVSGRIIPKPNQ